MRTSVFNPFSTEFNYLHIYMVRRPRTVSLCQISMFWMARGAAGEEHGEGGGRGNWEEAVRRLKESDLMSLQGQSSRPEELYLVCL